MMHPQIFERLKCKFQNENIGKGVGVRSFTRNILGVEGARWSFRMGIRMNKKWVNYSYGFAKIKQQIG
jgi:hypothetical protein